jgi:hypothetical protein
MRTLILFLSAMLMITPFTSFAGDDYTITITNQMKDELLAPVLIAPVRKDKHIFDGLYSPLHTDSQSLKYGRKHLKNRT